LAPLSKELGSPVREEEGVYFKPLKALKTCPPVTLFA
jgi:hypothetical protein